VIKIVALDVEESIPARTIILKRDLRCQLHQLFLGKLIAQTCVQLIRNIRRRVGQRVSQFNDRSFRFIEGRQIVAGNSSQFLIAQACFSAHDRIDVYSEGTTNTRCSANFSQLNVA